MRVVFVKHLGDNTNKEYLFAVPDYIYGISMGEFLIVHTCRGVETVTATSCVENISERVAVKFGAYLPLKNVILKIDTSLDAIIDQAKYAARRYQEKLEQKEREWTPF